MTANQLGIGLISLVSFFCLQGVAQAETSAAIPKEDPTSTTFSLDSSYQSSQNYQGNNNRIGLDETLEDKDHLLLYINRLSRTYTGAPELVDTSIGLGYVIRFQSHYYWENTFVFSPDAQVVPVASVQTRPHYVFGNSDISLGLTYNNSPILSSGVLSPQYLYQFSEYLIGTATIYAAHAKNNDISYSAGAIIRPSDRHEIRASYSLGRTIEDVDVEVNFNSAAVFYAYRFNPQWKLGPYYNSYVSDTRTENSYGLRFELTP